MAAKESVLSLDDLVGIWNMAYSHGEIGTFSISRQENGRTKIDVWTSKSGESEARDVVIEGDTITFDRNVGRGGEAVDVIYTARLVDGELVGTSKVVVGNLAFKATKSE